MKYKVGDKVRIIEEIRGHEFEMGEQVELMSIHGNGWIAKGAGKQDWHVDEDEIEPLEFNIRSHNVGNSDYSNHKIQVWDIWLEYDLNPFDADIIKRILRKKDGDSRQLDYEKVIHICEERIRQLNL